MKLTSKNNLINLIILCFIVYYPLFFTNNYYYGGFDFHIPTNYDGIDHLLFTPIERDGYTYFPHNYLGIKLILFIYKNIFNNDFYYFSNFYLLFSRIFCSIIIFLIVNRFTKDFKIFNIIVFFYLFNLHNFNAHPYWLLYYVCPGIIYIILKIYQDQRIDISCALFINIWIFFLSIELPNYKFLFYFAFCLIFTLFFIKINFYLILTIILIFISNTYLIYPTINFILNTDFTKIDIPLEYSQVAKDFHLPDHKYAYPPAILRGYHENFSGNPYAKIFILFNFFSYYLFFVILFLLVIKHKLKAIIRRQLNFLFLFIISFSFFLFSSNYIFGFFYDWMVNKIYYLRFLRTTSGSAFIIVTLYCCILTIFFKYFKNKKIKKIIFIFIIFNSIPAILGLNFKLETINETSNIDDHFSYKKKFASIRNIPDDYFKIKDHIKNDKRDGNILLSNIKAFNYVELKWISLVPAWFYSEILESNIKTYYSNNEYFYNIKGVIYDRHSKSNFKLEFDKSCIEEEVHVGKISYYKIKDLCFNNKFFNNDIQQKKCISNKFIVLLNEKDKYCNINYKTITSAFYLIENIEIDIIKSSIVNNNTWEIRSLDFFYPQDDNYNNFIKKKIYSTYLYLISKPIDKNNYYKDDTNYLNYYFYEKLTKKNYLIIVNYVEIYTNIFLAVAFVINIIILIISIKKKFEKY